MNSAGHDLPARVEVKVCRPGFGASCALCCGSHNYDADPAAIGALFARRARILKYYQPEYLLRMARASRSPLTGSYYFSGMDFMEGDIRKIYDNGARCPFVAFTGMAQVGCGINEGIPCLKRDCIMSYQGKNFSCRAGEVLSREEILFAAELCGDWYHYGILIQRGEMIRDLMRRRPLSQAAREEIFSRLEKIVREDLSLHLMADYFS